jgi:hypothetical protein
MKKTNQLIKTFFHAFFWCIILCSNSCRAQSNNTINIFFEKKKTEGYQYCMNQLKNDEDYQYAKKNNMIEITENLEGNCSSTVERYKLFNNSSVKLFDSLAAKNISDFIMINRSLNDWSCYLF